MGSAMSYLNRLLPFATPGTPLIQDIIHLAAICGALYLAPQLQERYRTRDHARHPEPVQQAQETNRDVGHDNVLEAEQPQDTGEGLQGGIGNDFANEDEANADSEELQHDQENIPPHAQPGPARDIDRPNQRNVGAKKAKALARRDQIRAYHEFQRAQGDAQRAADAEGAAEREAVLAKERERRRTAEAAVEAKKAKEREKRREQEGKSHEEELRRRQNAVRIVREELDSRRMSDLDRVARRVGDEVDAEWVERIITAAGMIGRQGDVTTMVTSTGWAVRVIAEDMQNIYQQALNDMSSGGDGRVGMDEMGSLLEARLRQTVAA